MLKGFSIGVLVCALGGWAALPARGSTEEEAVADVGKQRHEITVTANRIETPVKETGSSVVVIEREELERTGKILVFEALESLSQVSLAQTGPVGSSTNVQIRGAAAQHVKVMIDGVEVHDPVSTGRTVNLAHMLVENISRIEIVSGPQSTLYGSDAMGGVIHLITREETGPARVRLSAQGGSFGALAGTGELAGGTPTVRYNLGFGQYRSDGFSAAGEQYEGNTEADGYRNLSLFGKLGVSPQENLDLKFSFRFVDAEADIDNSGGDYGDDPNNRENNRNVILNGEARGRFWNNRWESKLQAAVMTNERTYDNPVDEVNPYDSDNSEFKGGLLKLGWQNNLFLHETNTLTFGIEHTRERGESEYHSESAWGPYDSLFPEESAHNTGVFVQDQVRLGGVFFASAGGRWDSHSSAGTAFTYRLAPSIRFDSTGTRFKASLGTGFKAPSLYQLYAPGTIYGPVGNSELKAEESTGWDAGIEQEFFGRRLVLEAGCFDNRFENLIDYDYSRGYINVSEASTRGFELNMSARPVDALILQASYTGMEAEDETTGEKLLRRPNRKFTARLGWRLTGRADLNLELIHLGERDDNFYQGYISTRVTMDPYTLINVAGSYRVFDALRLFFRLDNLFDQEYEVVKGYGTPGFSAFFGIKLDF